MKIGSFEVSDNSSVFIIAELSANHNGSLELAIDKGYYLERKKSSRLV